MVPPGIKEKWEDNDWWTCELILAYCAGRDFEDIQLAGAKVTI